VNHMFERRHYKRIALRLRSLRKEFITDTDWKLVVVDTGQMFQWDNPNFHWGKFKEACGYGEVWPQEGPLANQYPLGQEVRPERRTDYYDADDRGESQLPHRNGQDC
jgi:hypothetical protein